MAELRTAMARLVIYPRIRMGPDDALPALDMIALTERYLGRQSRERSAMLVLAKPPCGMSIREWCRECGRSRASLYRWAARGKRAVARRLEEDGVAVPSMEGPLSVGAPLPLNAARCGRRLSIS